jgi:hypothetical protein
MGCCTLIEHQLADGSRACCGARGLSHLPFVVSISIDAVVIAEQVVREIRRFEERSVFQSSLPPGIGWVLP